MFSGTKYPTANMYFPIICKVKLTLNEWVKSPNEVISTMAKNMLDKFNAYWNVIHKLMGVAAVLDPRYKMTFLDFYSPKVYPYDYDEQISSIKHLCYDLMEEYHIKKNNVNDLNKQECTLDGSITPRENFISFDDEYQSFLKKRKTTKVTSFRTELDLYLDEDVIVDNGQFDILLWWKVNGVKYPTLQTIARDILAIPVSTVASESAFSSSGRLVSPHRNRLHPKTIEVLMCAQSWLSNEVEKGEFISFISYFLLLIL